MAPNLKFVFLFLMALLVRADEDITVIATADGPIKGRVMLSSNGRVFIGFLAIPYAIPPVEDLRFKPPQPVKPWVNVLIAKEEGHICTQYLEAQEVIAGKEDCLTLNLFTHRLSTKVPILVWVHGGMFNGGNGSTNFNGPEFIMDYNIVYVTINYRLGPMGFMSTGDPHLPGNYGLKDQVLALKWIKRNAESFGGDPNTITVYGTGAGGVCTHYHMLSPLSSGLFSRLIYQSGSALNNWAFQRNPLRITKKLAKSVNCTAATTKEMVTCLKVVPVENLVQSLAKFSNWILKAAPIFAPVQEYQSEDSDDPPFLSANPEYLLKRGFLNNAPVITGHMKDELAPLAALIHSNKTILRELDENFVDIIRQTLYLHSMKAATIQKIRNFYLGDVPIVNATLRQLTDMFSDGMILYGVHKAARLQASSSIMPVYFYTFDLTMQFGDDYLQREGNTSNIAAMVGHHRLLPDPTMSRKYKLETFRRMWSLLSSFCATGNPTPGKPKLIPLLWRPVGRTGKFQYLRIDNDLSMKNMSEHFFNRMEFWDSIYHEMKSETQEEESNET